jgi:hypothetical protein
MPNERLISLFTLLKGKRQIFAGINSIEFKVTHASEYFTNSAKLRTNMLN